MFEKYPREKKHLIPNSGAKDNLKLPIFLIPGILGNSQELYKLAEEIDKVAQSERPIYIYKDPRANKAINYTSLDQHCAAIASDLVEEIRDNIFPSFLIVGYSFGCSLALGTAKILKEWNYDPTVYQIDSLSPSEMATFLQNGSKDVTENLIKIVNYAAALTGLSECAFKPDVIDRLKSLPLLDQFDKIILGVERSNIKILNGSVPDKYRTYTAIAKQNLSNLIKFTNKPSILIDRVASLINTENALKHNSPDGGWSKETSNHTKIGLVDLLTVSHSALIETTNCPQLATSINNYFVNQITQKYLFNRFVEANKNIFEEVVQEIQSATPTFDAEIILPSSDSEENYISPDTDTDEAATEENVAPNISSSPNPSQFFSHAKSSPIAIKPVVSSVNQILKNQS